MTAGVSTCRHCGQRIERTQVPFIAWVHRAQDGPVTGFACRPWEVTEPIEEDA